MGLDIIEYKYIEYFIRNVFISGFSMCLNYKILNIKERKINKIILIIASIFCANLLSTSIRYISNIALGMIALDIFIAFIFSYVTRKNIGNSLMITTISLSINLILYLIAIVINFIIYKMTKISNDYATLVLILLIFSIEFGILCSIQRIKNGISYLKDNQNNEYLGLLVLNIGSTIFFAIAILGNMEFAVRKSLFVYIVLFSIIMFITIQKSLQLYYKQKLQERETAEIKEELNRKAKEIEELEKENLRLSKANHSILHKQKSLEYELSQALLKNETMDKKEIKTKLQDISKEIPKETAPIELTKTNIKEIDNMLKYMQAECTKNKIDFELQINGNIHHMINKYIGKEELEILLADHIKNAIIAINHSNNINKNILVRLGIIDGLYSLYIYDSGIEFEVETLKNLGIKPSTTHADDGGTGMGFMNTFDTLKKYNASMEIHEYGKPSKDNFTKVIKIIFNNKHEYKISSYREKEIY